MSKLFIPEEIRSLGLKNVGMAPLDEQVRFVKKKAKIIQMNNKKF